METHSFLAILRGTVKRFFRYFLQGLLYIVPVVVIIWVLLGIFEWVQELIEPILPAVNGLVIALVVLLITIVGFAGTSILFRPIVRRVRKLLDRAPLIKTLYNAISDLLSAFVGKKRSFNQPVLVRLTASSDLEKLGFITNQDLSSLGIDGGRVAVYLPHSFAFSGNLYIVPVANVTILDAKAADVMKFIVSGGASDSSKEVSGDAEKPGGDQPPNIEDQ